jgi:hypothetical protein
VLPKDEINCTQDVAVSVKLVAGLGQQSILVSVKANTIVSLLGVISRKSNGLRATSIGVLDIDIVEFGIGCKINHCASFFIIRGTTGET